MVSRAEPFGISMIGVLTHHRPAVRLLASFFGDVACQAQIRRDEVVVAESPHIKAT